MTNMGTASTARAPHIRSFEAGFLPFGKLRAGFSRE
jgi:hypothetical protein